jgi:hypothetical protein
MSFLLTPKSTNDAILAWRSLVLQCHRGGAETVTGAIG